MSRRNAWNINSAVRRLLQGSIHEKRYCSRLSSRPPAEQHRARDIALFVLSKLETKHFSNFSKICNRAE